MSVTSRPVRATHEPQMVQLLTLLNAEERNRVDVAGEKIFTTNHATQYGDAVRALRQQRYHGFLLSLSQYRALPPGVLPRIVREYPQTPVFALLTGKEGSSAQQLLQLGQSGVRRLIDARDAAGWRDLRDVMGQISARGIEARALMRLQEDLQEASAQSRRFFEMLFVMPPTLSTIREFTHVLGVRPTTFMSRFFRAQLPAPKQYLIAARLVRAAHLLENPGCSITQVATYLNYSSPQSFSRHVQGVLQCGATDFR